MAPEENAREHHPTPASLRARKQAAPWTLCIQCDSLHGGPSGGIEMHMLT